MSPDPGAPPPAVTPSAERRTLVVAVVVMLALVAVGVVSAALFTRSACGAITPRAATPGPAGTDLAFVLDAAFAATDGEVRAGMAATIEHLAGRLGPVTGIAEVGGAEALAPTDAGVAAVGPVTTLLSSDGSEALAQVEVGDGRVVGAGDALFVLAVANELTGQVAALLPLTVSPERGLEAGTCVDADLVNTPLAFALDAADGELLLLRIDEDGSAPQLELRDPVQGRLWSAPVELSLAQPGVQGERTTARLGGEMVVAGRRTVPGDEVPMLFAVDRRTGEPRWTLRRSEAAGWLSDGFAQSVRVWAVAEDLVVIGLVPELPDGAAASDGAAAPDEAVTVVALSTDAGAPRWRVELGPGEVVQHVAVVGGNVWLVVAGPDALRFESRGPDGRVLQEHLGTGEDGRVAALPDGRVVAVGPGLVTVADGNDVAGFGSELIGRDVVAHDGGVTILFEADEGGAVAVTFTSSR